MDRDAKLRESDPPVTCPILSEHERQQERERVEGPRGCVPLAMPLQEVSTRLGVHHLRMREGRFYRFWSADFFLPIPTTLWVPHSLRPASFLSVARMDRGRKGWVKQTSTLIVLSGVFRRESPCRMMCPPRRRSSRPSAGSFNLLHFSPAVKKPSTAKRNEHNHIENSGNHHDVLVECKSPQKGHARKSHGPKLPLAAVNYRKHQAHKAGYECSERDG